jgi:hypothetical protein
MINYRAKYVYIFVKVFNKILYKKEYGFLISPLIYKITQLELKQEEKEEIIIMIIKEHGTCTCLSAYRY